MQSDDANSQNAKHEEAPRQSLSTVLQTLANYSVVAVFCLYVIGFIIWHTHLRRFHTYPSSLLQLEFLSAALCYVVTISLFAVPAACLFHLWHEDLFLKQPSRKQFISQILLVWFAILLAVRWTVFPTSHVELVVPSIILNLVVGVAMILGVISSLFCLLGKTVKILAWFSGLLPWVVATLAILIDMGINSDVRWTFILASLLLYAGAVSSLGGRLHELLKTESSLVKLVVCIFLGFVVLGNVVIFGISQFGSLPRAIGGGKPEMALIRFSSSEQTLGSALDLPFTNGFYGPVAILLRSEKEILFVAAKDMTNTFPQGMQVRAELVDSIRFLNPSKVQRAALTNGAAASTNSMNSVTNLPTNKSNAVVP